MCVLMSSELGLPSARPNLDDDRRRLLSRRIRWFVAATIGYNVVEAIMALTEGSRVSSAALIGFGLDSVIEVSSAAAVAWQFAGAKPEAREKVALRVIAFSFFGLALFVSVDAIRSLFGGEQTQHSTVGIVLAGVSLAVMPVLSWAQRRAGRELGSLSAVADSKQTLLCTYLSAVLLVGLVLNSTLGWSWADPIAALVIAVIAAKEGINAWRVTHAAPLQRRPETLQFRLIAGAATVNEVRFVLVMLWSVDRGIGRHRHCCAGCVEIHDLGRDGAIGERAAYIAQLDDRMTLKSIA